MNEINSGKASSSGRINISGKISTNGKAAPKANSGSNKKPSVNAGKIQKSKVTKKASGTGHKALAGRYGVNKAEAGKKHIKPQILAKPPFTKTTPRNKNPSVHTLSTAPFLKSMSNQSLPFNMAEVSTQEKRRTKPTNGYKQVQHEEPLVGCPDLYFQPHSPSILNLHPTI